MKAFCFCIGSLEIIQWNGHCFTIVEHIIGNVCVIWAQDEFVLYKNHVSGMSIVMHLHIEADKMANISQTIF